MNYSVCARDSESLRRWRDVAAMAMVAALLCLGARDVQALHEATQAAKGDLIRICGTSTLDRTAATAVQQQLDATMKVQ